MSTIVPEQGPINHVFEVVTKQGHGFRNTVIGIGMAGLAAFAALTASDHLGYTDLLPGLPDFGIGKPHLPHLESQPAEVEASIIPSTYAVPDKHRVVCQGTVSAGVGTEGSIPGTVKGDEDINKVIWGDFGACGPTGTTEITAFVHRDTKTNNVTEVTYDGPGLVATRARVDETNPLNCVAMRTGDSQEKRETKTAKWQVKKAAGKDPGCDDGLGHSWDYITTDVDAPAKLSKTAKVAVQIGLGTNGDVATAYDDFNQQYENELKEELEKENPGVPVNVHLSNKLTAAQQLKKVNEEVDTGYYKVLPVLNKQGDAVEKLEVSALDGSKVTIKMQPVKADRVNITEFTRINPTTP